MIFLSLRNRIYTTKNQENTLIIAIFNHELTIGLNKINIAKLVIKEINFSEKTNFYIQIFRLFGALFLMKLAEALILQANHQNRILSLKNRINHQVLIPEGEEPSEDPNELLKIVFTLNAELQRLKHQIHLAHVKSILDTGERLIDLLVERDTLDEQHQILTDAIKHTFLDSDNNHHHNLKWVKVIPVSRLQKYADDINARLCQLNIKIQAATWNIDVESLH